MNHYDDLDMTTLLFYRQAFMHVLYSSMLNILVSLPFSVGDRYGVLDDIEKVPVSKRHSPEMEVRTSTSTLYRQHIHANPIADKDFKPDGIR